MYYLYVNVYCTIATGSQPIAVNIYIISYVIISYIISYIIYHISYNIISSIISDAHIVPISETRSWNGFGTSRNLYEILPPSLKYDKDIRKRYKLCSLCASHINLPTVVTC